MRVEKVSTEYFFTEKRYQQYLAAQKAMAPQVNDPQATVKGTVGCVALDVNGVMCAGTSTGGMTNKRPGRGKDRLLLIFLLQLFRCQ